MTRKLGTLIACLSVVLFPWPLTAFLSLSISLFEPLVPLAVGMLADTLYYAPVDGAWPHFAFFGALASGTAIFVRSRLKTGSIKR